MANSRSDVRSAPNAENHDSLRHILLQRLEAIAVRLTEDEVRAALSQDDPNMLVTVLMAQILEDKATSPLAKARARGIERRRQIVEQAGGTVPLALLAEREGVKPESIRRRIQRGALIALQDRHGYHIPSIQLDEAGRQYERLGPVLTELRAASPYRRLEWLMQPHSELQGRSPMEIIRSGQSHPMLRPLARAFGEQGGG
ncbi:MAG: hypothetical protein L0H63_05605 [Nitrococcus sp.]|nr:hypothetical protein [Nitrococcus sp.]